MVSSLMDKGSATTRTTITSIIVAVEELKNHEDDVAAHNTISSTSISFPEKKPGVTFEIDPASCNTTENLEAGSSFSSTAPASSSSAMRRSSMLSFLYGKGGLSFRSFSLVVNKARRWPHLSLTLFITITGWVCFFILGSLGWPGKTSRLNCLEEYLVNPGCFCERPLPGRVIAQPVNTISNLVFNLVAIFISWCADTKTFPNPTWYLTRMNLLTQSKWFSLSFGPVITNIGYSSAFMHAGWNDWADKLDSLSILLMFLWLELFSLCKFSLMIVGWTEDRIRIAERFHAGAFIIIGVTIYIADFMQAFTVNNLFEIFGLVLVLEVTVQFVSDFCKKNERMTNVSLGLLAALFFGGGFAIQIATQSGSKFCNPESFFQGHALWHICAGTGVMFLYFFFLSDNFTMVKLDNDISGVQSAK